MCPVYARGMVEHFGAHVSDKKVNLLNRALEQLRAARPGYVVSCRKGKLAATVLQPEQKTLEDDRRTYSP